MDKRALLKKVGSIEQEAFIRTVTVEEGRAKGMRMYEVKAGKLAFTAMEDKCLDLASFSYKGENLSFLSKPGLQGRNHYDTNGQEAQRSIMGGMLFTCGLKNFGAPCFLDGVNYPMHGRIRTTPASQVSKETYFSEDGYHIKLAGEMRQAELFGENLSLRRTIETVYPGKTITIHDKIENESYREEPFMILYHFNVGYPLLDCGCEIVIPAEKTMPRDEAAQDEIEYWKTMQEARDNQPEQVFLHDLCCDEEGNTFAAVINRELSLGLKLTFDQKNLPYFMQWKSPASGDYALGLEPANLSIYGKKYHKDRGDHPILLPFETKEMKFSLTVLETEEEFKKIYEEREKLLIKGRERKEKDEKK